MPSNLNIKYGNKTGVGNIIKASTEEGHLGEEDLGIVGGTIYAAENSIGEIEMYMDTPKATGATRKRLDPRIFVGSLDDVPTPSNLGDNPTQNAIEVAKTNNIWNNYDVWIDTSGDPTGNAMPADEDNNLAASSGLMSAETIQGLSDILFKLKKLKLQIVSQDYWNNANSSYGINSGNLANWLTIIIPNSAVPNGTDSTTYRPVDIDFSEVYVTPQPQSGGNES